MKKLPIILFSLLLLVFSGLIYAFYQFRLELRGVQKRVDLLEEDLPSYKFGETSEVENRDNSTSKDYQTDLENLRKYVDQSIASVSGSTKKEVTYVAQKTTSQGVSYITMGNTYSTSSMIWKDVPGSETYIDLTGEYPSGAIGTWSASLKVAHGNGQAFARLYDATNTIAVDGSEISTTNNADYTQAISGNLAFWRGKNLYKVQIKSLNSFEVTYGSGKIKIAYY